MVLESDAETSRTLGLRHKYFLHEDKAAPLVLLVHGRAGTFDVMWTFRRCLPDSCSIIAPQAPEPDILGGYSWWDADAVDNLEQSAEPSARILHRFLDLCLTHYQLAPRTIIALGFSQGGGLLSLLMQRQPQIFKGVGLLASFVIEVDEAPPAAAPTPSIFIAHGTRDDRVPVEQAQRGRRYLLNRNYRVEYSEDPVGHKVGAPSMRKLSEWLAACVA